MTQTDQNASQSLYLPIIYENRGSQTTVRCFANMIVLPKFKKGSTKNFDLTISKTSVNRDS